MKPTRQEGSLLELKPSEFAGGDLNQPVLDLEADNDQDGLPDCLETQGWPANNGETWYSDPTKLDTDGEGLPDGDELKIRNLAQVRQIVGSPLTNAEYAGIYRFLLDDPTITALTKFAFPYANPQNPDSDNDAALGIQDRITGELVVLDDLAEQTLGTDPRLSDTDGDGSSDPQEAVLGTSRTDPQDNRDADVTACFKSGGNLLLALPQINLNGRILQGCETLPNSCIDQLDIDAAFNPNGELECAALPPNTDPRREADLGSVVRFLATAGDGTLLDNLTIEVFCTIGGCGLLVEPRFSPDPIEQGDIIEAAAEALDVAIELFQEAPRPVKPGGGATVRILIGAGAVVVLTVVAAELAIFQTNQQIQRVRNRLADKMEATQRRINPSVEPNRTEMEQRADECLREDAPWQDIARSLGLQDADLYGTDGFKVSARFGRAGGTATILSHVCNDAIIYRPGDTNYLGRRLFQTTQHQREALGRHPSDSSGNRQQLGNVGKNINGQQYTQNPWQGTNNNPIDGQAARLPNTDWYVLTYSKGRDIEEGEGGGGPEILAGRLDRYIRRSEECTLTPEGRRQDFGIVCDEFPFRTTVETKTLLRPGVTPPTNTYAIEYPSLKLVNDYKATDPNTGRVFDYQEGTNQGNDLGAFERTCRSQLVSNETKYLVLPQSVSAEAQSVLPTRSFWSCETSQ